MTGQLNKRWWGILIVINLIVTGINSYFIWHPKTSQGTNNTEVPELTDMTYFSRHDITQMAVQTMFELPNKEYLIYFYAPDCSACQLAGQYVAAFIYYGLTDLADIYFVDVSQRPDLECEQEPTVITADTFGVVYTPTLLYFASDGTIERKTGAKEVYELLDNLVPR
jgi:thiol-disulfide isomerase/thioredoxin